jgi:hypothetical protein
MGCYGKRWFFHHAVVSVFLRLVIGSFSSCVVGGGLWYDSLIKKALKRLGGLASLRWLTMSHGFEVVR